MSVDKRLLVVLGKKPRASKTSVRYEYGGERFFLFSNKTTTSGSIFIFQDVVPYPLIAVIAMGRDDSIDKAKNWIKVKSSDIKSLLGDYRHRIQLPLESWTLILKNQKKLNRNYDIYDDGLHRPFHKLVVVEHEGKYLYLSVDDRAPTKRSKLNNIVTDNEEILAEYLRRVKENERIREFEELSRNEKLT